MYQESVDKSGYSSKADIIVFLVLIVAFFGIGAIVLYLEDLFSSMIPRYIFIGAVLLAIYLIYRIRLVGYRYTIFYKEPEPVYDPRFDDMMIHEDYQYPVGTLVFERIVSAKGVILLALDKKDIVSFNPPNVGTGSSEVSETLNVSRLKEKASYSIEYKKGNGLARLYFSPSQELIDLINGMLSKDA